LEIPPSVQCGIFAQPWPPSARFPETPIVQRDRRLPRSLDQIAHVPFAHEPGVKSRRVAREPRVSVEIGNRPA